MDDKIQEGLESVSIYSFSTICQQTKGTVNQNHIPLNVEVSYQQSKLRFQISSLNTLTQNSNNRYYFVYDQTILNTQQLGSLVDTFYTNLKLGDLIKIINVNFPNIEHNSWIEKTKTQKSIKDLLFTKLTKTSVNSKQNLKKILKKVFTQSLKYSSNYVSVALFLGNQFQINNQLFLNLQQLKKTQKYFYQLWVFIPKSSNMFKQNQTLKIVTLLPFNWQDKIINYISLMNSIILKNFRIKIQCLNGSLSNTNQIQSPKSWVWKDNKFEKSIYSLTKHTLYCQQLVLINNFQKIELSIEIKVETLKGQFYTLFSCLQISGLKKQLEHIPSKTVDGAGYEPTCYEQKIKFSKNKLLGGQI